MFLLGALSIYLANWRPFSVFVHPGTMADELSQVLVHLSTFMQYVSWATNVWSAQRPQRDQSTIADRQ